MIRIDGLAFGYGPDDVLRDIDLDVATGEILSIVGPNGSGKSTLLKLLRRQLIPRKGSVRWQGREVASYSRRELARLTAVVPQHTPIYFPFPVRELVLMGRYARQRGWWGATPDDLKAVEHALAVTDTLHLGERAVTDLSGGELQRVLLARALAQETPTLLLDEATCHLDLDHRLELAALLVRLNRDQGTTVVQVSHDLDMAAEISGRIFLLDATGRRVALGTPQEVFTAGNIRRVFRVDARVETNPWSGAPRIYPTATAGHWRNPPRVHVICGGGSGGALLRRLDLVGCRLSAGPLNQGDSDHQLTLALGLDTATEQPFSPISAAILDEARALSREADALLIAPTVWGPGNLACLELAREARDRQRPVIILDPRPERDYTGGRAWSLLQELLAAGAQSATDTEAALERLRACH